MRIAADTTFAALAHVDPTDHAAKAAGLPPIDGVNLWPRLSGASTAPPRQELFGVRTSMLPRFFQPNTDVQGPNFLIVGDYKLLLGDVTYAVWTGPQSPNATTDATKQFFLQWNCSECQPPVALGRINCTSGCLYDVRLFVFLLCCACVC